MAIWASRRYLSFMIASSSLQDFVGRHRRLFVLTGAGCSTNSGIPDYRDVDGKWKRQQPVTYQIRPPAPAVAPLSKERSELYVHTKRRTGTAEVAAE